MAKKNSLRGVGKRNLTLVERKLAAIQYRRQGASYAQIGEQLGVSSSAAYQYVDQELKRLNNLTETEIKKIRQMEVERLDALLRAVYPRAIGNPITHVPSELAAVDRCLRIAERRARLLGLDQPERIEASINDSRKTVKKLSTEDLALLETIIMKYDNE